MGSDGCQKLSGQEMVMQSEDWVSAAQPEGHLQREAEQEQLEKKSLGSVRGDAC